MWTEVEDLMDRGITGTGVGFDAAPAGRLLRCSLAIEICRGLRACADVIISGKPVLAASRMFRQAPFPAIVVPAAASLAASSLDDGRRLEYLQVDLHRPVAVADPNLPFL